MVNKSVKSSPSGFFEISFDSPITDINQIDLNQRRNLYVVDKYFTENGAENFPVFNELDIRLVVDSEQNNKILTIEILKNGKFEEYSPLWELYKERNKPEERYTLNQLLSFAKDDYASKKENFISDVLADLKEKGWFLSVSPVALYDDIIVGRKKSKIKKKEPVEKRPGEESDDELEVESSEENGTIDFEHYQRLLEDNPNMIFYGPPGTGKTYTAQRVIEYLENKETKKAFEEIVGEERVQFITFHQSYSYEEFVEGIRPVFNEDGDTEEGLGYQIVDGIVKKLANRAALTQINESSSIEGWEGITKNSQTYKVSLGYRNSDSHIYEDCLKNNYISIGWFDENMEGWDSNEISRRLKEKFKAENPTNDTSSIDLFLNQMNIGDIVLIYDSPSTIRDIGVITGNYEFKKSESNLYSHRRSVRWIKHFDTPFDILEYNGGIRLTLKTIYPLNRIQFSDIRELLSSDEDSSPEVKNAAPCYLIIDEINRGNISKIFGELITLIEKDKRNKLKVTLPYSRKNFSFPSNIYILGTMNTADRSIAILDTALRRRFTFVELLPDPEVLKVSDNGTIEDKIDLALLLAKMNEKILKKFDRDHQIGHSYFMDLNSMSKFRNTWFYKIIPLLMDYFYNDAKSVSEIIGEKFINPETGEIARLEGSEFIDVVNSIYR